jgi:hypothetical protein
VGDAGAVFSNGATGIDDVIMPVAGVRYYTAVYNLRTI